MKNNCEHIELILTKHQKDFEGEIFKYQAQTCVACNAIKWTQELERKYEGWINELSTHKRHLFQVQYSITSRVEECIAKLLERFPYSSESLLIRALVLVYIGMVEDDEVLIKKLDLYIKSDDYNSLASGKKISKKLQFGPSGFNLILSYSKLFDLKPGKIIDEALNRMILLSVKEDKKMKDYWENVVLKDIEKIVNAA